MFLNWVYRIADPQFSDPFQPPIGFRNYNWTSVGLPSFNNQICSSIPDGVDTDPYPDGCPDLGNPGMRVLNG